MNNNNWDNLDGKGRSGVKGSDIGPEPAEPKRGRGRPKGKHSNKEMVRATAYIPKNLYKDVKIKLMVEEMYFSDLIEKFLHEWIKK